MNQRDKVRATLREHGPMGFDALADALALEGVARSRLHFQLHSMTREGFVTSTGRRAGRVYADTGKPVTPKGAIKRTGRTLGSVEAVRTVLRRGDATAVTIRLESGLTARLVSSVLCNLQRDGAVAVVVDEPRRRVYRLQREPATNGRARSPEAVAMLEAEKAARAARKAERERQKASEKAHTQARVAQRKAQAAEKRAAAEARAKAKRAQKEAEAQARADAEQTKRAHLLARLEAAPVLTVEPERVETVEEWMARTGKQVERVPGPWEVRHG